VPGFLGHLDLDYCVWVVQVLGYLDRAGEHRLESKLGEQNWGAKQGGRGKSRE